MMSDAAQPPQLSPFDRHLGQVILALLLVTHLAEALIEHQWLLGVGMMITATIGVLTLLIGSFRKDMRCSALAPRKNLIIAHCFVWMAFALVIYICWAKFCGG